MGKKDVALAQQLQHRVSERVGLADAVARRRHAHRIRRQLDGGCRIHGPIGDNQRPGAGVEERLRQTGETFSADRAVRGGGVTGRQHDPIGVEMQLRDLGRLQQPIIPVFRIRRKHDRGFGQSLDFAGYQAVGGKGDDAILG